ncbi:hypothetical protein F5Y19DRAFT_463805 [Xylariaceae sp. FL1651]|nr:hypothetical protein F5Y19DRAFT_463805 [Xylariaceae sp. FL1651]
MFPRRPTPFSSAQGRRKHIKKLYNRLKHSQADDVPLPSPTVLEIKFYLRNHRRCHNVYIDSGNVLPPTSPNILLERIPRFIASQLEAQQITDTPRHSVQLSIVLVILSDYLATDPTKIASVPTLLLWHGPERRRTFYLFAYLVDTMESRTYSTAQLLSLRAPKTSETAQSLLMKLKLDPEIDNVVSKEKRNVTQAQNRFSKKPKAVSSTSNDSDEIIFQGKKQAPHVVTDVQWKYRGRTGSDVTSSEPLPAPSGLDKQHSEGFQRFFKAVVSPTHVRVTAGGRIVPNTRGSISPTTKWDRERPATDAQDSAEPVKEAKAKRLDPVADSCMPPMIPPMFPSHPMFYQHIGMSMPFYPPMQNGFAYPYGLVNPGASFPSVPYPILPERQHKQDAMGSAAKPGGENDNKPERASVKISPPEQFDQSRPFYFNGQVICPPMGMGPGPIPSMITNHCFLPGAIPSPTFPVSHMNPRGRHVSAMPMVGPNEHLPASFPVASGTGPTHQQWLPPTVPQSGAMPPISSIRPSVITRNQLNGLRHALKYHLDQLQYNRHQIDEPWIYAQAQRLKDNIRQFEQNLQMQLRFEKEHYPNMEPTPKHISEGTMSCRTPSGPPSIRHTHTSGSSNHGSIRSNGHIPAAKYNQPQVGTGNRLYSKPNRLAIGINSNKTDNSTAHIDALEAAVIKRFSAPDATPQQKAMLEAITRPLNPHHDAKHLVSLQISGDNDSSNSLSAQQVPVSEKRYNQEQPQSSGASSKNKQGSDESTQSAGAFFANGKVPCITPVNGNGFAVPYLVGDCPPGTDPWTYRGHEFVYSRELTEDEKQARHIYWGQLSSKGSGLPKFDGKDFYLPSPQKAADDKTRTRCIPSGRPDVDFGFEPRRSEIDPFRFSCDADSIRSYESSRRLSKAIPIVAPPDVDKKLTLNDSTKTKVKTDESANEIGKLSESFRGCKPSFQDTSLAKSSDKKKSPPLNRRVLERSSTRSGHDLWQTMLKKGSTSGNALPGAVSSTTATGYLPQYSGNAIASLGPTISNSSPARVSPTADNKFVELEGSHLTAEKTGENCPPSSAPSIEHDITKDLHERMLRDAERRGVIGSDWQ